MFSFELDFFPRAEERGQEWYEFDGRLQEFLGQLWCNSNILPDWHVLELGHRVQARVLAPEVSSLDVVFFSPVALQDLAEVEAMCERGPQFRLVAPAEFGKSMCGCEEPSCYVLFPALRDHDAISPIDCGHAVPLYRLPFVDDTGEPFKKAHWTLQAWAETYRALDWLFLHSSTGERFAFKQLSSPWSDLMREGRRIASQLEEKMCKPVYVFLQQWHPRWGNECPLCGQLWRLEEPWSTRYDFKCERSRLVCEGSYTDSTPMSELHP